MPRPRTKTARLTATEVTIIRHDYGTITNAWARLGPTVLTGAGVTWHQFRIAAGGGLAAPRVVDAIRAALKTRPVA